MAGIKLYHPTVRPPDGAQYAVYVVETEELYPVPYMCPLCTRAEERKSIHLRIGSDGYVIVSPEVWEKLQPVIGTSGLETKEEIANPPPITVGAVELPKQAVFHHPLNLDQKHADKYNPGRTKEQSREKVIVPKLKVKRKPRGRSKP